MVPGLHWNCYEWTWYLMFFIFGYICIVSRDLYYEFLGRNRNLITSFTMVLTVAFVLIRLQQHKDGIPYMDGGWIENDVLHNQMTILSCFIHSFRMVLVSHSFCMGRPSPQQEQCISCLSQSRRVSILHRPHATHIRWTENCKKIWFHGNSCSRTELHYCYSRLLAYL